MDIISTAPKTSPMSWNYFKRFVPHNQQHTSSLPSDNNRLPKAEDLSSTNIDNEGHALSVTQAPRTLECQMDFSPHSSSCSELSDIDKHETHYENKLPAAQSSFRRRRATLGYTFSGENQVACEFRDHLMAVNSSFSSMVNEADTLFSEMSKMTKATDVSAETSTAFCDQFVSLESKMNAFTQVSIHLICLAF